MTEANLTVERADDRRKLPPTRETSLYRLRDAGETDEDHLRPFVSSVVYAIMLKDGVPLTCR